MPMSKMSTRMCFEISEVASTEYQNKIKWVVSKYLTHLCYPIRFSCDVTDDVYA